VKSARYHDTYGDEVCEEKREERERKKKEVCGMVGEGGREREKGVAYEVSFDHIG
jgi:hypothetical protein